jgi:ketosteroid isomerase-like protein
MGYWSKPRSPRSSPMGRAHPSRSTQTARSRTTNDYLNKYVFVIEVSDGQILEVREHLDIEHTTFADDHA